jgi:sulfite dehydrogenase
MKRSVIGALIAILACGAAANGTQATEAKAGAPGASAGDMSEGRRLFTGGTTPSCAVCHTLRDASGSGNIGPDLDELKPDAARVAAAVQKGFENMPAFGHVLSPAQIDTLAHYVAGAAGK